MSQELVPAGPLALRQEKELALAISSLCAKELGKPESVVQVRVESSMTISFGGVADSSSAFLVIAFIGSVSEACAKTLPGKVGALLAPYGIDPKKIFLRYMGSDASCWGWN